MPFQAYRATTKIHLGGTHISEQEVVEFDGSKLRRQDGTDLELEYPSAFLGAVKAGWVVLDGEEMKAYVPQPAGVEVRSAKADGTDREVISVGTVFDEDQTVGKVVESMPQSKPAEDAMVVGKLKSAAKAQPIKVGTDDRRVVKEIESRNAPEIEKVSVATGDVEEAISGEELSDLLPDAATSGQPKAGISGEEATFSRGSSTVATPEDGVVVGKVAANAVDWDMSLHWKARAKRAVELYRNDLPTLNSIMAVEKRGVQKEILRHLYAE